MEKYTVTEEGNVNLGYINDDGNITEGGDGNNEKTFTNEDVWNLMTVGIKEKPPFNTLSLKGKLWRIFWHWIFRYVFLIGFLYLFICSIGFLGSAFQLLGGKAVGEAFSQSEILKNPIAGLMIGVLATVLVQSSSTTTSIIVAMVGTKVLNIDEAVFIVMGANIGTSVTNTIVALGQISNKQEFRRAFAGATVHDMFNWLTVIILLPIEAASGFLRRIAERIVPETGFDTQDTKRDFLKVITKPFTSLIISIDKKIIQKIAKNASYPYTTLIKTCCKKGKVVESTVLTHLNTTGCFGVSDMSNSSCYVNNTVTSGGECIQKCKFMFQEVAGYWKDYEIGAILLVLALVLMTLSLIMIVKLLQSILQGHIAKVLHKFINADFPGILRYLTGYVAIILGAGFTILVQSSSIFTSSITPLVGVGVITIYRMYPLTLGSNIGTTFTSVLAALSVDKEEMGFALRIAMCHLFFNIFGIIIWYPLPFMRKVPVTLAKKLGDTTAKYRWFAVFYLFIVFFILPAIVFGLSLASWIVLAAVLGPIVLILLIIVFINILQVKAPRCLPHKLKNWDFLPLWMHSLRPLNTVITKYLLCCKFCLRKVQEQQERKNSPTDRQTQF